MVRTIKQSAFLLALVVIVAASAQANSKYKKYMQQSLGNLLLMCIEGDVNGSYFYAGMQAKHGNLKKPLTLISLVLRMQRSVPVCQDVPACAALPTRTGRGP